MITQPQFRAPSYNQCRQISTKATAVVIRGVLKEAFPGVKFGVRIENYAGGSSINIQWEDGPTENQVRSQTKMFEGSRFDGMTDNTDYHDVIYEGEWAHFSPQTVHHSRRITQELLEMATAHFEKMKIDDPEQYHTTIDNRYRDSGRDLQYLYARKFSIVEFKGSTTIARMLLENDEQHPAFRTY
jgi:hypothetical protein